MMAILKLQNILVLQTNWRRFQTKNLRVSQKFRFFFKCEIKTILRENE